MDTRYVNVPPTADESGAAGEEDPGIRLRGGSSLYSHHQESDEEEEDMMTSEATGGASGSFARQPTQPGSSIDASPRTILNAQGTSLFPFQKPKKYEKLARILKRQKQNFVNLNFAFLTECTKKNFCVQWLG